MPAVNVLHGSNSVHSYNNILYKCTYITLYITYSIIHIYVNIHTCICVHVHVYAHNTCIL